MTWSQKVVLNETDDIFVNNSCSKNSPNESVVEPMDMSSVSSSNFEFKPTETLHSKLATWAVQQNISHIVLNGLFGIVQGYVNEELPMDARTVLRTPKQVEVVKRCGGDFIYFGIKSGKVIIIHKTQATSSSNL